MLTWQMVFFSETMFLYEFSVHLLGLVLEILPYLQVVTTKQVSVALKRFEDYMLCCVVFGKRFFWLQEAISIPMRGGNRNLSKGKKEKS